MFRETYPNFVIVDNDLILVGKNIMDYLENVLLIMKINFKDECPRLRSVDECEVKGRH